MAKSTFEKIWDDHVIGDDLLFVDLHLVHEVTSPQAFEGLRLAGRKRAPARPDARHRRPQRADDRPRARASRTSCRACSSRRSTRNCEEFGVRCYGLGHRRQGIVHVIGPELGVTQPGMTIVCGDSHTSTHGAFGALAFGIGTSEVEHVLATQTLPQRRPQTMQVRFEGLPGRGVVAKDLILGLIGQMGTAGADRARRRVHRRGDPRALDGGPHDGLQHVDRGRRAGRLDLARRDDLRATSRAGPGVRELDATSSAGGATLAIDGATLRPRGRRRRRRRSRRRSRGARTRARSSPITGARARARRRRTRSARSRYMALSRARAMRGRRDRPRLHRLVHERPARGSARRGRASSSGKRVAEACARWSCPARWPVKLQAEAEGLDRVFTAAGFEWRSAGCSMCLGMNPDILQPGERCASTSNRNFEGRQGRGGRTHLVSPEMAAAAADRRPLRRREELELMEPFVRMTGATSRRSIAPTSTPTRSSRSSS